jgi:cobalt/nickel transport system permease protein
MHMADALISTAVGGATIAGALGVTVFSNVKIKDGMTKEKIPLMGVMGAFVFAAQMINFTIPGTGSSGHLAGGLLLSAMLGPYAGYLAMFAVLLIQALFFADGGLLAFGCNLINMGFFACFIAYPLIFKPIVKKGWSYRRILSGSVLASVTALTMGAFAVVLETLLSGKTQLPFGPFAALMLPIHLAIGLAEGLITSAVLAFVYKSRPEVLEPSLPQPQDKSRGKKLLVVLIAITVVLAAGLFWFASANPDGLEWSLGKVLLGSELQADAGGQAAAAIQQGTSVFADYGAGNGTESFAGVIGAAITLVLIAGIAFALRHLGKRRKKES